MRDAFHSRHESGGARTWIWRGFRVRLPRRRSTYGADPKLHFSGSTIHLIAEALDVVERIDDEDLVLGHLALHGSKESPASGLLRFRVYTATMTIEHNEEEESKCIPL